MSNPLDDALRAYDREQRSRGEQDERRRREEHERSNSTAALIEDFLRRMNAAGNPGTNREFTVEPSSLFGIRRGKAVSGWALTRVAWDDSPSGSYLFIRTDGLVMFSGTSGWARPRDLQRTMRPADEQALAANMAAVLRKHGVS